IVAVRCRTLPYPAVPWVLTWMGRLAPFPSPGLPAWFLASAGTKKGSLLAAFLPCSCENELLIPRSHRPHRPAEACGFRRALIRRPFQHQGAQAGHHTGAGPLSLFAYRQLPGGQVLQAE